MFITPYCTTHSQNTFSFTREQASRFAKQVANDFNPIHDEDSKRFCVPGDLLFARILSERGVSTQLKVSFNGMVNDGTVLTLEDQGNHRFSLKDDNGKEYLELEEQGGERITDPAVIERLIRSYVSFSGENFPHLLVPLMKDGGVMINPSRPLVIYESMSISLQATELVAPELAPAGSELKVDGRRGTATLHFEFRDQGQVVGTGVKTMVLSSLREYTQTDIDALVDEYNSRRDRFAA
ncbi:DUF3581 domain-containing protein [Parendozoicomonas haliclonae]|uniref:DUF3581 domain-containing protein n=2 Tax=Parendozoicomonas haliclonae TaxID=1960125 RepID=A0A1X7ALP5_9GAMM|nr:hypothetical protein EHSB41UT_03008 [Parendozoicomonas haliclonae]